MAIFELRKTDGGQFNFSLKNDDGKTLLKSEQYQSKASAENGIESIRKNSTEDARYAKEVATSGKLYFNLKATNGQIIGTSVLYGEEKEQQAAMDAVKTQAAKAKVDDQC